MKRGTHAIVQQRINPLEDIKRMKKSKALIIQHSENQSSNLSFERYWNLFMRPISDQHMITQIRQPCKVVYTVLLLATLNVPTTHKQWRISETAREPRHMRFAYVCGICINTIDIYCHNNGMS